MVIIVLGANARDPLGAMAEDVGEVCISGIFFSNFSGVFLSALWPQAILACR